MFQNDQEVGFDEDEFFSEDEEKKNCVQELRI